MRADGGKYGVEALVPESGLDILDLAVELQLDPHVDDALDLVVQDIAWQAIFWDAEAHHAAGHGAGFADCDGMAEPGEVIGSGKTARPGADHEHALARALGIELRLPAMLPGRASQKALDGVDADGLVQLSAIARRLARVVADAAHDAGQRIVRH